MDPVFPKRDPLFPGIQRGLYKAVDAVVSRIHVHKHAQRAMDNSKVTHERPFLEGSARLGGLTVGLTFSELHSIRAKQGVELIQVVDTQGNSNYETVLWRRLLFKFLRIELQGPALNTNFTGGGLPLDVRILGLGATGDLVDRKAHEAVSYTAEVKIHLSDLIMLAGSGAGAALAGMIGTGLTGQVAQNIAYGCSWAVPVVGGLIALSTVRWAEKVLASQTTPTWFKWTAFAHAVSDTARIFFPLAGTLANAALVGVSLAFQYHLHKQKDARKAQRLTLTPSQ